MAVLEVLEGCIWPSGRRFLSPEIEGFKIISYYSPLGILGEVTQLFVASYIYIYIYI